MIYLCDQCQYRSQRKINLRRHIKNKHLNVNSTFFFKCEQCTYSSKKKSNLRRHILRQHLKTTPYQTSILCPVCKKTFDFRNRFIKHLCEHHNVAIEKEEFQFESESGKFRVKYKFMFIFSYKKNLQKFTLKNLISNSFE